MLSRLIHYLKGSVVLRISGTFPERFVNVCAARGILLRDVKRLSKNSIRLTMSIHSFRLLPPIARRTGVRVKILRKSGFFPMLQKHRKRKVLLIGTLVFMLLFIGMNQFVWKIEIVGNEKIPSTTILENLKDCGLSVGAFRHNLNQKKIKNDMLIKMTDLSWLWAEKKGSKVIVTVKEKIPIPEIFDANDYCSIVAAKDGVVHSMIVRNGFPTVTIGDTVQKNSLLVSGMLESERGVDTRYLQAEAEIYARTWYEKTKAFSLFSRDAKESGAHTTRYRLSLFGLDIPCFLGKENPYNESISESELYELSFFGNYLGISLSKVTYREIEYEDVRLAQDFVIENGIRELCDAIDADVLPNSELLHSTPSHHAIDEDTVEVTVVCEYLENIAQKVKMERPAEELP